MPRFDVQRVFAVYQRILCFTVNQEVNPRISWSSSRCHSYLSFSASRKHQTDYSAWISWKIHLNHERLCLRKSIWTRFNLDKVRSAEWKDWKSQSNCPCFNIRQKCLPSDIMQIQIFQPYSLCFNNRRFTNSFCCGRKFDSRLIMVEWSPSRRRYHDLSQFVSYIDESAFLNTLYMYLFHMLFL
jgi:hypothetical protein